MGQNSQSLKDLRKSIDNIDSKISELLQQRLSLVKEVGDIKTSLGDSNFCRPAREAIMTRDLIEKNSSYDPIAIYQLWRLIISSSLNTEQKLSIQVLNSCMKSYWYTREYFGSFTDIEINADKHAIFAAIKQNNAAIAVMNLKRNGWWRDLVEYNSINQDKAYIFAQLPYIYKDLGYGKDYIFALAKIDLEPGVDDKTLIVVNSDYSEDEILNLFKQNAIKAEVLDQDHKGLLILLDGFQVDNSDIQNLDKKMNIEVIGAYAAPMEVKI